MRPSSKDGRVINNRKDDEALPPRFDTHDGCLKSSHKTKSRSIDSPAKHPRCIPRSCVAPPIDQKNNRGQPLFMPPMRRVSELGPRVALPCPCGQQHAAHYSRRSLRQEPGARRRGFGFSASASLVLHTRTHDDTTTTKIRCSKLGSHARWPTSLLF